MIDYHRGGRGVYLAFLSLSILCRAFMQEQLPNSEAVLEQLLPCLGEAVLFVSTEGEVVLYNEVASDWFCTDEGGGDLRFQLPDELAAYLESARKNPESSLRQSFRFERAGDGESEGRPCVATVAAATGGDGSYVGHLVVVEDAAEPARNLRTSQGSYDTASHFQSDHHDMAQHEKMVAIGTMAAGIAHEIGNPLASLSAVVQLLKRRHDDGPDSKHLHTLEDQIERIAKIVRQILEFSRPATSEWVLADLDEIIEQTVTMVSYSHRARHASIESIRNRELPRVRLMPQLFQQVLVNLLLNALDAVEEEGPESLIKVERACRDGWVHVTVEDRGRGMDEEQIRQVFEPFYTTKPPGMGTGLGLAVSYRLVERQGGRIEIDSAPGKGTVATVYFRAEHDPEVGGARP